MRAPAHRLGARLRRRDLEERFRRSSSSAAFQASRRRRSPGGSTSVLSVFEGGPGRRALAAQAWCAPLSPPRSPPRCWMLCERGAGCSNIVATDRCRASNEGLCQKLAKPESGSDCAVVAEVAPKRCGPCTFIPHKDLDMAV